MTNRESSRPARFSDLLDNGPGKERSEPSVQHGQNELDRLLADLRSLAHDLKERDSNRSTDVSPGELDRIATALSAKFDAFPDRVAEAIAQALANQHRLIIQDVRNAVEEIMRREISNLSKPTGV